MLTYYILDLRDICIMSAIPRALETFTKTETALAQV